MMEKLGNDYFARSDDKLPGNMNFYGVVDVKNNQYIKKKKDQLKPKDLRTYDKFFKAGSVTKPLSENTENMQKIVAKTLKDCGLEDCLGVIGGYLVLRKGNNVATQESPTKGLVKLLGGKAPGVEMVNLMTDMRHRGETQQVIEYFKQQKKIDDIISIEEFSMHPNIHGIFPLWIEAVTAKTIQDCIKALQKIGRENWGIEFLIRIFKKLDTSINKNELKSYIYIDYNESPIKAGQREVLEESGYYSKITKQLGLILEYKLTKKGKNPYRKGRYILEGETIGEQHPELIEESDSEKGSRLSISDNEGITKKRMKINYLSGMKLGIYDNVSIDPDALDFKLSSHITNSIGINFAMKEALMNGRVSYHEYAMPNMKPKIDEFSETHHIQPQLYKFQSE